MKIENSMLHSWRHFITPFDLYSRTVDYADYVKFCQLIDQIFQNLFNIEYHTASSIPYEKFKCYDDLWEDYKKNEDGKNLRKIDTFCEIEPYHLKVSFIFDTIDNHSIFERCEISTINKELLAILPMGPDIHEYAHCVCLFKNEESIQYQSSAITYFTTVSTPLQYLRGYNFDYPSLVYNYSIHLDKIFFKLEYLYKKNIFSYSEDPSNYFSIEVSSMSEHNLLRVRQLYSILSLYSAGVDLTSLYPDINYDTIHNPLKLNKIMQNFIQSDYDETDNILLLDMLRI